MFESYEMDALQLVARCKVREVAKLLSERGEAMKAWSCVLNKCVDLGMKTSQEGENSLDQVLGFIGDLAARSGQAPLERRVGEEPTPATITNVGALCDYLVDELKMPHGAVAELLTEYGLEECVWCREAQEANCRPSRYIKAADQMSKLFDQELGGWLCLECAAAAAEEERKRAEETKEVIPGSLEEAIEEMVRSEEGEKS